MPLEKAGGEFIPQGPWSALKGKGGEKSWAHQEVNLGRVLINRDW